MDQSLTTDGRSHRRSAWPRRSATTPRALVAAIAGAAALATVASTLAVPQAQAAGGYAPRAGVLFNNPAGSSAERHVIRHHVDKAIANTPRGETIRIAQYAINFESTTRRLVEAHNRGVDVKVIVDDRHNYREHRTLRAALGKNRSNGSFFYVCESGCRVRAGGTQHAKFLTFTRSGTAQNVVMVSSGNLTGPGADWGWNDHYTWRGKPGLHKAYVELFEEMTADSKVRNPYRVVAAGGATSHMVPQPGATLRQDPVSKALDSVTCSGAADGAGRGGKTLVQVSMFGWTGDRGLHLASKLRKLDRDGCVVEVIVGKPAQIPLMELRRPGPNGGVAVRDSRFDRSGDGRPDLYVHTKYMLISGHVAGDRSATHVYTGSQNWFDRSQTHDDELIVHFDTPGVHSKYQQHFSRIWTKHSTVRENKPLSAYSMRSFAMEPELAPVPEVE